MIKRHWFKLFILCSLIGIWFWKGYEVTRLKKEEAKIPHFTKIDTVSDPFVLPEIKPNVDPAEKKIYKKKDTTLRKQAGKKDIILDIKIVDNHVIEDIIDTSGQVKEIVLDIAVVFPDEIKEITIVPEGVQIKEKTKAGKFLQKVGKGVKKAGKVIVIGLATVGVIAIIVVAGGG